MGGTYRYVDNRQLGGKDRCVDRIHEISKRYIKVVRQVTGYSLEVKAHLWTMGRFGQVLGQQTEDSRGGNNWFLNMTVRR